MQERPIRIDMENPYLNNGDSFVKQQMKRVERLEEPNKGYAIRFRSWMELQGRAKRTIAKRLEELVFILQYLGPKDAKRATQADIEGLVVAINNAKRRNGIAIAIITRGKIKMTLRVFYKFLFKTKSYPEIVEDIKPEQAKNTLLPSTMLSEEDIRKLISVCMNPRDKALISLLWSGMRIGELLALKVQDVRVEDNNVDVIVVGKTGQRAVSLMNPTYLTNYMHEMKKRAEPEDPLFVTLTNGVPTKKWVSHATIRKVLHDLKVRVPELKDRRIYPHLFRHSFASFLAGQNFNPEIMRRYFGWASNDMANVYVHLNDQTVRDAIHKLGKREVKPIEIILTAKTCWRCCFDNEPDRTSCRRCTADLINPIKRGYEVLKTAEEMENLKKEVQDLRKILNKLGSNEKRAKEIRDVIEGSLSRY